jgi:membrane protease subunit HflK
MEKVYSSTSKVLIDSESSGNLLYLPIDKLGAQSGDKSGKRSTKAPSTYDQIELETQAVPKSSSQTRSDSSRQGRY